MWGPHYHGAMGYEMERCETWRGWEGLSSSRALQGQRSGFMLRTSNWRILASKELGRLCQSGEWLFVCSWFVKMAGTVCCNKMGDKFCVINKEECMGQIHINEIKSVRVDD